MLKTNYDAVDGEVGSNSGDRAFNGGGELRLGNSGVNLIKPSSFSLLCCIGDAAFAGGGALFLAKSGVSLTKLSTFFVSSFIGDIASLL